MADNGGVIGIVAAASAPTWVWAALVMAGFVGLTLITMALARLPVRRPPPPLGAGPVEAPHGAAEHESDTNWVVAGVAPDQATAKTWTERLIEQGVPAQVAASDPNYRVLVPEERLKEAQAALARPVGEGPET